MGGYRAPPMSVYGTGRGKVALAVQFMSAGLRQQLQQCNYLEQAQVRACAQGGKGGTAMGGTLSRADVNNTVVSAVMSISCALACGRESDPLGN